MDAFPTSLQPLPGGFSGETFLADAGGEEVVVRIYGRRSAARGPAAPEIDAAVLELVGGLLPVPRVLEVRRGRPEVDEPGLLVTTRLPGDRLDLVLPALSAAERRGLGERLGVLLGRLGHMVQPRPGILADRSLTLEEFQPHQRALDVWLDHHAAHLDAEVVAGLGPVVDRAQDLLEVDRRACLVHGDLNPKNLLVDPGTLVVTGVLDWEFAHSGTPWTDLGNLLRFERDQPFVDGVLAGYTGFMPGVPGDLLDLARAVDLFSLVELAAQAEESEVVVRSRGQLAAVARTGDLHAVGP